MKYYTGVGSREIPQQYPTYYNLILLENSNITTQELIELFQSLYSQYPKSFIFIFDFSLDVKNCIDFSPILEYISDCEENIRQPELSGAHTPINESMKEWMYYVVCPYYLGKLSTPTSTARRLDVCDEIINNFFGNKGNCYVGNVYYDMKEAK